VTDDDHDDHDDTEAARQTVAPQDDDVEPTPDAEADDGGD